MCFPFVSIFQVLFHLLEFLLRVHWLSERQKLFKSFCIPNKNFKVFLVITSEVNRLIFHSNILYSFLQRMDPLSKKTDEWCIEWQQVTTNDTEWQQMIKSGTKSVQRTEIVILANFPFFRIRKDLNTRSKENPLNFVENLLN